MAAAVLLLAGCAQSTPSAAARLALSPQGSVTSTSPLTGSLSGGTVVDLTGHHLADVATVTIGGQPAPIVERSAAAIRLTTPASLHWQPGRVEPFVVRDGSGSIVASFDFVYESTTAVDRQLAYAFRHWNDYNLNQYGDFNVWGGDCMNFVSQTLVARGWTPTADWFNDAQEEWAPAFVHVPSFDDWLAAHPEYGAVKLAHTERSAAAIGDVVVFDWDADGSLDHAQIISDIHGSGDSIRIAMVGHNLDTSYRDLDAALATQGGPDAQAWIWSIPS